MSPKRWSALKCFAMHWETSRKTDKFPEKVLEKNVCAFLIAQRKALYADLAANRQTTVLIKFTRDIVANVLVQSGMLTSRLELLATFTF